MSTRSDRHAGGGDEIMIGPDHLFPCPGHVCRFVNDIIGNATKQALDIGGIDFSLYAVILLLITLVFRFLLYIVLLLKKR